MELMKLLEKVAAGFVRTKSEETVGGNGCGATDVAVSEIALMIGALDGTVRPEEFASYRWIVGRCPELSEADRKKCLDDAVRKAGRVLMMAQIGAYSEAERLAAFGETVGEVLPDGFEGCSAVDVRRAFVLWLAMAVSDDEYAGIERQAVELLRQRLTDGFPLADGFFETAVRLLRMLGDPARRSEAERELDDLVVFAREG